MPANHEYNFMEYSITHQLELSSQKDGCCRCMQLTYQQRCYNLQAKAARERLLMKSKQSLKTVPTAILPNEDDIPSSSDNSDVE